MLNDTPMILGTIKYPTPKANNGKPNFTDNTHNTIAAIINTVFFAVTAYSVFFL